MEIDENGNPDVARASKWAPLSPEQIEEVRQLKLKFNTLINDCRSDTRSLSSEDNRLLALARTKLEEACMWAVKALTSSK